MLNVKAIEKLSENLILYKSSMNQQLCCTYIVNNDHEVKLDESDRSNSMYILAVRCVRQNKHNI